MMRLTSAAAFSVTMTLGVVTWTPVFWSTTVLMLSCSSSFRTGGRERPASRVSALKSRVGRLGRLLLRLALLLLLVVLDGRLDGVLGQHGAVDLDRRQAQLLDDRGVLDLHRLLDRLALEPLGRQAAGGDGAAAAERLELRVLDPARHRVDLDLQLHDIAALGRADDTGPDVDVGLV